MIRLAIAIGVAILLAGCGVFPEVVHQPVLHNPFPQLTKVAVAPFFNLSTEPTVDGRQFALAYFNQLQLVPGFEVVPVGVVERAAQMHKIQLSNPSEARRLAQILGVDAIVIGAVTDFNIYYPPRCGMQVEWYAANSCFHPIPPGYGLPWGTPQEEFIPGPVVLEAEMALARAQLKTQTPISPTQSQPNAGIKKDGVVQTSAEEPVHGPAFTTVQAGSGAGVSNHPQKKATATRADTIFDDPRVSRGARSALMTGPDDATKFAIGREQQVGGVENGSSGGASGAGLHSSSIAGGIDSNRASEPGLSGSGAGGGPPPGNHVMAPDALAPTKTCGPTVADDGRSIGSRVAADGERLPLDWPDPRGFLPPPPTCNRPMCEPSDEPVLRHTRTYNGNDGAFTTALENYYFFQDEARFGGWQSYLQRSDDFISFCCHMHIYEMLGARGGVDETRVVWRWPNRR